MKTTEALRYKITAQTIVAHPQFDQVLEEIWIPSLNICINSAGGCFECDNPRNENNKEVEITEYLLNIIKKYFLVQNCFNDEVVNILF